MSVLKGLLRGTDFVYSLRFLRLLTTKWENTGAFKAGIVDKNGKVIKKPETADEKASYTLFHRLVFNIKRLINKVPLVGKSTLASYAAALYLIKEHCNISELKAINALEEVLDTKFDFTILSEWNLDGAGDIKEGIYVLEQDIALPTTGEVLALRGSKVKIQESEPVSYMLNVPIFEAYHIKTKSKIYITNTDVRMVS